MRYKEYKKVDLPWLNEVPSHWETVRNKNLFKHKKNIIGNESELAQLLSLTTMGIKKINIEDSKGKTPMSYDTYQRVCKDDLVLCLFDLDVSAVFSDVSKYCGMISPAYQVFESDIVFMNYYKYIFDKIFQDRSYKLHSKSLRYTITPDNFLMLDMIVPPKEEQEQIARFLDWKINEIDRLIELEKQKIKKLEINFTIIINNIFNAVDGEKVKLKYIFEFGKGLNVTKDDLSENGIKCISYGEIHGKNRFSFSSDDKNLKSLGSHVKLNTFANLNQGDFVFCDTSEDLEGSGNFSYKKDSGIVYASYHTIVAKPKVNFNSEYIAYFFESDLWRAQIRANAKGIKVYSITQFILKDSYIILPDIHTQKKIVKNLNRFNGKKINLAKNISDIIKNLESLKQSLISDVVTGRLDVRGIEIPNHDKVYDIEDDSMLEENFNEEV